VAVVVVVIVVVLLLLWQLTWACPCLSQPAVEACWLMLAIRSFTLFIIVMSL